MRNLTSVLAITAILATPAFAENTHQHEDSKQGCAKRMDNQKMTSMHEHMEEMKAQMESIKTEQDPEKRQQLMQEHMESMQEHMESMQTDMQMMKKKMKEHRAEENNPQSP